MQNIGVLYLHACEGLVVFITSIPSHILTIRFFAPIVIALIGKRVSKIVQKRH